MTSRLLATLGSLVLVSPAWAGTIVNGGFENGLNGWTASNASLVTAPAVADKLKESGAWVPTEGIRFGYLLAGEADAFTTLEQTFTATAGQVLKFDVFFDAGEDLTASTVFEDFAEVEVIEDAVGSPGDKPFAKSVADTGATGSFGWEEVEYSIQYDGDYTLIFRVKNVGDGLEPSALGVDNVRLEDRAAVVPLPGAVWGGVLMLGLLATRRLLGGR